MLTISATATHCLLLFRLFSISAVQQLTLSFDCACVYISSLVNSLDQNMEKEMEKETVCL